MNAQTPAIPAVALENADVIRWLDDNGPPASIYALAREFGRDGDNFRKTLVRIEGEGVLILKPKPTLTDFGRQVRAAIDVVQGLGAKVPEGFRTLTHDQLEADPNQPRADFDEADLQELEDDIVARGRIMQNLGVRPPVEPGAKHRIKLGERRWRAVGRAIQKGRLPADFPIPVEVKDADDRTTLIEAFAENDKRSALNAMEKARTYERLATEDPPLSNAEIAKTFGKTPEHVQQHRRLFRLPEDVQALVRERKLSVHEALKLVPTGKKAAAEARAEEKVFEPKPPLALVLVEVAERIAAKPHHTYADSTQAGRSAQTDKALGDLVHEGFAGWAGDPAGARVWLTDKARNWLAANRLDPREYPDALFLARQRAGLPVPIIKDLEASARYGTDWLNYLDRPAESEASKAREAAIAEAPRERPGLTGDQFSRQLRAAMAQETAPDAMPPETDLERHEAAGLFAEEEEPAVDQAEAARLALVQAATPSPEDVLARFFVATDYVEQMLAPLNRLRLETEFAWQEAECPDLARHLVEAVKLGDVLAVAGLAAALYRRGGDMFSQRSLTKAWEYATGAADGGE